MIIVHVRANTCFFISRQGIGAADLTGYTELDTLLSVGSDFAELLLEIY